MGIKDFFVRKMIESKMKDVPAEQREMLMSALESNPDFFMKIAEEIEMETKKGRDQMTVAMEVMNKHKDQLQKILIPK